jgi:hypothetical protein
MGAPDKVKIRPLMLRLPKSLHFLLARGAKKSDRSLNAEIVWRLELSFDLEGELAQARLRLEEQELASVILGRAKQVLDDAKALRDEALQLRPLTVGGGLLGNAVAEIEKKGGK